MLTSNEYFTKLCSLSQLRFVWEKLYMGISERKKREKGRLRNLILDTARKLFVEFGFEKVTLRRIAGEIEYSPATIYLYFKNKDEILFELHDEGFEKFYNLQLGTISIKDPWERLRFHGMAYIKFAVENPEFYDLMFIMRGPVKALRANREWKAGLRSFEFLKQNLVECMEAGYLAKGEPETVALAFWSLTHGISSLIIRQRCIMFPENRMEKAVEEALGYILDNIKKK